MDIRTKLVLALVAVALGSMIALGGFMYLYTSRELRKSRMEQLDGLAESMRDGMEQIASGWEDRVRLIASRTNLRDILRANNLERSPEARTRIDRILADAANAVRAVETLAVYDAEGHLAGSAGWALQTDLPEELTTLPSPEDAVIYEGVRSRADESFRVAYQAALTTDGTTRGELVGVLVARLTAEPLARLALETRGLGASGEAVISIRTSEGGVRVLKRSGAGREPHWEDVELRDPSEDPIALAMSGQEGPYPEGMIDDTGVPVWAAGRHLQATDWGLVVKIDAVEGQAPALAYRRELTNVVISLAAFAILFGTLLGLHFAKPIHELAATAERIKDGDLSIRAPVRAHDEVGLLARNFNQMAEELEHQVTLLKEFQNYFDYSLDMLCIAGQDGYFKRVNPAFERTLGWSTEELLSRSFLDFVHPDDLGKTEREIERLGQGLPTISFENRYMCQDGTEKILAWTAHPQPDTGLIYAIARDVTDLTREREESASRIDELEERLEEARAELRGDS